MPNELEHVEIASPNGQLALFISIRRKKRKTFQISYSITLNRIPVILESELGIFLWKNRPILSSNVKWAASQRSVHNEWQPVYGEQNIYPDNYNEVTIRFRQNHSPSSLNSSASNLNHPQSVLDYAIVFRLYDEGFAVKYDITAHPDANNGQLLLRQDATEFHFPPDCHAYEEHGTEGEYRFVRLDQIKPECERPLTVVYPNGFYLVLTEANNYDFPRMLLRRAPKKKNVLIPDIYKQQMTQYISSIWPKQCRIQREIRIALPYSTPWRVGIIGLTPGEVLEHNYLIKNLCPPTAYANTKWIKPGKVFRDITLSTPNALKSIDFAHAHHIDYLMFDAGWYGPEGRDDSDATTVTLDPDRTKTFPQHPGLDLSRVCQYAKEKGVAIILYVNHRALRRQLDIILPIYREWGIAGIKFGFVGVGHQEANRWIHEAVKKCADYNLIVNIHDNYRPTGLSRTYPNLLTQEGIRGNEHMPTARHNCTLPFTRFPMGAGDATICYYDARLKTTHAHQLAMAIIIYSPLQTVLWYDKPDDHQGEAEIALFEQLPTYWDETKVLLGVIGEYALLARRKGQKWFVGGITNEHGREITINCGFLAESQYSATIFEDVLSPEDKLTNNIQIRNYSPRTRIRTGEVQVSTHSKLHCRLQPAGGVAVILTPKT